MAESHVEFDFRNLSRGRFILLNKPRRRERCRHTKKMSGSQKARQALEILADRNTAADTVTIINTLFPTGGRSERFLVLLFMIRG